MVIPLSQLYVLSRQLAKTTYYQTLYSHAKEIGLALFINRTDLTELQIIFLNFLTFYNGLNIEIATGDIDPIVKTHYIYEDAWAFYRQKARKKEIADTRTTTAVRDRKTDDKIKKTTTKFVFRRK